MLHQIRRLAVATVLLAGPAIALAQDLPPAPIPVTPGAAQSVVPAPMRLGPPPAPAYPVLADVTTPPPDRLLKADELVRNLDHILEEADRLGGWYTGLEVNVLNPHLMNHLQAPVHFPGFFPEIVQLSTAPLAWAGSPSLTVGYRMPDHLGAFEATYRFLVSEGQAWYLGFDLDGADGLLQSRLDVQTFDFDYATRHISMGENWDIRWKVGLRLAVVYFDSQAFGKFIEQRTSNHFDGVGPHFGLELNRRLGIEGLGLVARVEGATPVGTVSQNFSESVVLFDSSVISGNTHLSKTQGVPTLNVQLGLTYRPTTLWRAPAFSMGYEFEQWWYLGHIGANNAELTTNGIFFRGEWNF